MKILEGLIVTELSVFHSDAYEEYSMNKNTL